MASQVFRAFMVSSLHHSKQSYSKNNIISSLKVRLLYVLCRMKDFYQELLPCTVGATDTVHERETFFI